MFPSFDFIKNFFKQRVEIYIVAIFLSLVLFNTTYLSLGTYLPISIIAIGIVLCLFSPYKTNINSSNSIYLLLAVIIFISTIISDGNNFRECFKIFITILFVYKSTKLLVDIEEVKFLSFIIVLFYFVYAVLVIQAIGGDTVYYGRAQIKILNSNIPLDPNVISAAFVLPFVISFYNFLYGKFKLMAAVFVAVFLIAILALGSRGASLAVFISLFILLIDYFTINNMSFWYKIFILIGAILIIHYGIMFISGQEGIYGLSRILDFEDDDISNGRTSIWGERLELLMYSPIWGYGANYAVGTDFIGKACHNTILQILHYSGIVGFFCFIIPTYRLYKRENILPLIKLALFLSVLLPIFFIDTLQERTLWNFIIYYSLLTTQDYAEEGILWD